MSTLFEKLAESSHEQTTSEHLKLLGKRAANLYISKEAGSLTEAVHQVVGDNDLSREQISRVSEMANQETWRSLFVEQDDRSVNFEPADAATVIGALATRPEQAQIDRLDDLDYSLDVPGPELNKDVDWENLFGVKKDSPEYEALNPARAEEVAVEKVASALDVSRSDIDNAASLLADAAEEFYKLAKQAYLQDDIGILQISKAAAVVMEDSGFARDVMQKVAARLESEGVKFNNTEELRKVAHPLVVNHEHPLAQAAVNLERSAFAYYSADIEFEKLSSAHQKATRVLRDKLRKR